MGTNDQPPVVISMHVEGFGDHRTETMRIARPEWDEMTPAQRVAMLDRETEEFASNHVGFGWHIDDPADLAAATEV